MGLLTLGTPLDWPQAREKVDQVRQWGVEQLLAIWNRAKKRERDAFLWGDEIEYLVVNYDDHDIKVTLSLRQAEILSSLGEDSTPSEDGRESKAEQENAQNYSSVPLPTFHPEFGRFMLEGIPGKPWGIKLRDLLQVESNMKLRRKIVKDHMLPGEYPITLTTYPRLGCSGNFTQPYYPTSGDRLRSQFVPDEIANPHIRFPTLAQNIRSRRGRKVQISVPIFRDKNTTWPWRDPTIKFDLHKWPEDDDVRNGAAPINHIYMDAMAFGMGSCCLQITFQAKNINEGRLMYDQLSPLGPILLALTAATPIYKGFLADTDVRWNQISASVDDRTPEEMGEKPLKYCRWHIPKSRYASNSTYISQDSRLRQEYLESDLVFAPEIKQKLINGGMDPLLATHFAHLFARDPLVIFSEDLQEIDLSKTDHFENFQSTNWQHIRFKPPPSTNNIGWRVEFRPMEIQITDFENAAFSIFIILLTRAILSFNLNFYIPIRKTDENMQTAHKRNAVLHDMFYFRKNIFTESNPYTNGSSEFLYISPDSPKPEGPVEEEYSLMCIDVIMNGSKSESNDNFPGLIPIVEKYLDIMNLDFETRSQLGVYLDLVRKRSNGTLWTTAKWIREFVQTHEEYKADSQISDQINHDLIGAVLALGNDRKDKVKNIYSFLPQRS